jgi:hypothetical protein
MVRPASAPVRCATYETDGPGCSAAYLSYTAKPTSALAARGTWPQLRAFVTPRTTQSYLKTETFYAKCCKLQQEKKVYRYFPDVFFAIFHISLLLMFIYW